ncbi:MAG: hypothetical protein M3173_00215 [Chloroflexota bacterium]|nr:hypothetical protein [Chloroflexota bacterium]
MEPFEPGSNNPVANLRTDGPSVPWTPREIRAERRRSSALTENAVPFVVQAGPSVLMIEQAHDGWVLAELRFDGTECLFRDIRLSRYSWPREAFGVLLSRLASSDLDAKTVDQLSTEFAEWLATGFARMPR